MTSYSSANFVSGLVSLLRLILVVSTDWLGVDGWVSLYLLEMVRVKWGHLY